MSPELLDILRSLSNAEESTAARTIVFRQGERVRQLYLVEAGEVRLQRDGADGNTLVLQRAGSGAVLAEASLHARHYHCDGLATCSSRVRIMTCGRLLERFRTDAEFAELWCRGLADDVREMRTRNEILRLRTVRSRLDAWLAWQGVPLPPRGTRQALAHELGVSPEALYREMARRETGR